MFTFTIICDKCGQVDKISETASDMNGQILVTEFLELPANENNTFNGVDIHSVKVECNNCGADLVV